MPVPGSFSDLSTTPSANSPLGTENVGTIMNQYIQAAYAFIAQLNANMNPTGTLTAPSGTRIVMQQAAAPAGWTVDTSASFTDVAMRFNQSVGSGGTNAFSTWNAGSTSFATAGHALTVAELASHNHTGGDTGHGHAVNDPLHTHGSPGHTHSTASGAVGFYTSTGAGGASINFTGGTNAINLENTTSATAVSINSAATGVSLGTGFANISINANGGGAAHSHNFSYQPLVKYADCIVAIKS